MTEITDNGIVLIIVFSIISIFIIGAAIGYQLGFNTICPDCYHCEECVDCEICSEPEIPFNISIINNCSMIIEGGSLPCDLSFYNIINSTLYFFTENCTMVCSEVLCDFNYTNSSMICHHCFRANIPTINNTCNCSEGSIK